MTKERYADLHVHTYYSDSTFSPEEVLKAAHVNNLNAIAITDHDTVDGISPCEKQGEKYGIEIIPGIELTVDADGYEVHILGFFIDRSAGHMITKIKEIQKSRVERMHRMIELLKEKEGIAVDAKEVFQLAGHGTVGRLHLASVMLKSKQIKTIRAAFDKYIGHNRGCYVPHLKFSPKEAIDMVLKAGGVPVLAHPAIMARDEVIPEFAGYGLRGIEVFHTDHNHYNEKRYLEMAKEYGLLVTGGSDCHGMGKGRILLGSVMVKYELVEKLRAESDRIKRSL